VLTIVAVGVAGSFGAVARYALEGLVSDRTGGAFPWGTLVVNISGSFVLGALFAALVEGRIVMAPWLRTGLTIGLVGAYTTFSTLTVETVRLLEDGAYASAAGNALGSLALGLVAAFLGVGIGRLI
jgi:CrcB protein